MYFQPSAPEPFPVQAEVNIKTNFRGPLDVCKGLFPLLRPHARYVNEYEVISNVTLGAFTYDDNF